MLCQIWHNQALGLQQNNPCPADIRLLCTQKSTLQCKKAGLSECKHPSLLSTFLNPLGFDRLWGLTTLVWFLRSCTEVSPVSHFIFKSIVHSCLHLVNYTSVWYSVHLLYFVTFLFLCGFCNFLAYLLNVWVSASMPGPLKTTSSYQWRLTEIPFFIFLLF